MNYIMSRGNWGIEVGLNERKNVAEGWVSYPPCVARHDDHLNVLQDHGQNCLLTPESLDHH